MTDYQDRLHYLRNELAYLIGWYGRAGAVPVDVLRRVAAGELADVVVDDEEGSTSKSSLGGAS